MRDLAVITFLSLDGVMQAPVQRDEDLSGGFTAGGWTLPYLAEVMAQVGQEAFAEPLDLLFGRKTYELFAAHWPNVGDDDPHAKMLNEATKYVVTSTPGELPWQNSRPIGGDVAAEIARLKAEEGPLLQIHGSWQLIQSLLAHDLIDEFRLWTFPLVLGRGKRLFEAQDRRRDLTLVRSGATEKGVVMGFYRRLRAR